MKFAKYFTKTEIMLWSGSVFLIFLSFFLFDGKGMMTLFASLIGATSLIFNAKGNPISQILTVLFSVLYGIISYSCAYYGEMITYLGMTAPIALLSVISWLKNPYCGNRAEAAVNRLKKQELWLLPLLTVLVTALFYFKGVPHCKSSAQHHLGHHQLSCGLSDLSAERMVRPCLRGKRYCFDRPLGFGRRDGRLLRLGHYLFCCVFGK